MTTTGLIDKHWFPHANYDEQMVEPEFIERHISMRDVGFYQGNWPDIAAGYGYCLTMHEFYSITKEAEHATRAMVKTTALSNRVLNVYEQRAFDTAYAKGYMVGQSKVAKQLYELALMGEFKAIDKFLEVRGAFGVEATDTGPSIQISLEQTTIVPEGTGVESKIVPFPKKA